MRNPPINMEQSRKRRRLLCCQGSPPDGGWSWVVMCASFINLFLLDGTAYNFGIFFPDLLEHFQSSKASISLALSVKFGVSLTLSPFTSALMSVLGGRLTVIIGGLISSISLIAGSFCNTTELFILTYGVIGGVGAGMLFMPSIIMIGFYFKKRRALAMGITVCGTGFGTFTLAPVTEYLLQHYTWEGVMWIHAGLLLNCVVLGSLYRPPSSYKSLQEDDKEEHPMNRYPSLSNENSSDNGKDQQDDSIKQINLHSLNGTEIEPKRIEIFAPSQINDAHETNENPDKALLQRPVSTESAVGTVQPTNKSIAISIDSLHYVVIKNPRQFSCDDFKAALKQMTKQTFNKNICTNPTILLFGLTNAFLSLAYIIPYAYLPMRAMAAGVSEEDAAFLISIIGISGTIGRVFIGYSNDRKWIDAMVAMTSAACIGGIVTALAPLYFNYALLAVYCTVLGVCYACIASLSPIVCIQLVGLNNMGAAFGFYMMCAGITAFAGPPLAGFIADTTGNFDGTFYFAGAMFFTCGVLIYPVKKISEKYKISKD